MIYEVYRRVKSVKGEQAALEAVAAISQTRIVALDKTLSLEAADLSLENSLHFADALVYATARHYGVDLYTSDPDMRGLKGIKHL